MCLIAPSPIERHRYSMDIVTFRFSPRSGFCPVKRAFANSNPATTTFDGPSHSSAPSTVLHAARERLDRAGHLATRHHPSFSRSPLPASHRAGPTGEREIRTRPAADECETYVVVRFDFIILGAPGIGQKPDHPRVPIGPGLHRPCSEVMTMPVVSMGTPT